MGVDLGPLIGTALENTLDAKGATYAVEDSNEIVLKVPIGSDGTPDLSNAYFVSDAEYQIHEIYVNDTHVPREVDGGSAVDCYLTIDRDSEALIKNYRAVMGIKTLYALHNGQKLNIADMKFADGTANDGVTSTAPSALDNKTVYVHLRVLKLVPA